MTDEFDPHSSPKLKLGYLDNETGSMVTSIRKALSKWNYAKDIYCIDDRDFGTSICFVNGNDAKMMIGVNKII